MGNTNFAADNIRKELDLLDLNHIPVEGILMKPSQCYYVETNPVHVLFNTNCPCALKDEVMGIVKKYYPDYETGA